MQIFNNIKLMFENRKLKKEIEDLNLLLDATEKRLDEKNRDYRRKIADNEMLKEKLDLIDRSLYNANKTLDAIIEVAGSNDYSNYKIKIAKIIELAKKESRI